MDREKKKDKSIESKGKKLMKPKEEGETVEVWVKSDSGGQGSVHFTEWFIYLDKQSKLLPNYLHLVFETSKHRPPGELRVDLSSTSMYLLTEGKSEEIPRSKVLEQAEKYYRYYLYMAEEAERVKDHIKGAESSERI